MKRLQRSVNFKKFPLLFDLIGTVGRQRGLMFASFNDVSFAERAKLMASGVRPVILTTNVLEVRASASALRSLARRNMRYNISASNSAKTSTTKQNHTQPTSYHSPSRDSRLREPPPCVASDNQPNGAKDRRGHGCQRDERAWSEDC
jgi:hypothetical protein